jgi:hypothetical protein
MMTPIPEIKSESNITLFKTTFSCDHIEMHSQEAIQGLIEARLASVREASEKRDVDALMSWHAKDAVFNDVGTEAEPKHSTPT